MFVDFFNISKGAQKHYKYRGYGAVKTFFFFFKSVEGIGAKILYLDYGLTLALRVFRVFKVFKDFKDLRVIRVTITHNAHHI